MLGPPTNNGHQSSPGRHRCPVDLRHPYKSCPHTRHRCLFHSEMVRNQKEKSEEPWVGRRILGVAAAGAVAVAAGAFFMLSRSGDGAEQEQTAGRTMKGPDTDGERISRDKFEADPKNYFQTSRQKGPKAVVDAFK